MIAVLTALAKAFGQMSDRAVIGVLAKSVLVTLLLFAGLGAGLYFAIVAGFEDAGFDTAGLSDGGFASAAAAAVIAVLAGWLLFRVVALAVLQLFADEIVAAVEVKHYPVRASQARNLPLRRDMANALRGVGRTVGVNLLALPVVILLLATGVGAAAAFLAVNAWLLGRELTDMAWLRHCGDDIAGNPVPRGRRIMLGAVIAGMMAVPFLNLIAPVIGAAAGTHLTLGGMDRAERKDRRAIKKSEDINV